MTHRGFVIDRSPCGLAFSVHPKSHRPELHLAERMSPIATLRRDCKSSDVACRGGREPLQLIQQNGGQPRLFQ
jgi:hypothetical protein